MKYINIIVNNRNVSALLDSGASIPVLHSDFISEEDKAQLNNTVELVSCFGTKIKAHMLTLNVKMRNLSKIVKIDFAITDQLLMECVLPPRVLEVLFTGSEAGERESAVDDSHLSEHLKSDASDQASTNSFYLCSTALYSNKKCLRRFSNTELCQKSFNSVTSNKIKEVNLKFQNESRKNSHGGKKMEYHYRNVTERAQLGRGVKVRKRCLVKYDCFVPPSLDSPDAEQLSVGCSAFNSY